ncbi:MAG TPA: ABC transporter ATP-binding protein [Candidatus Dormibacteraeota bacterium]|nr:ABC transporter ATP-binding protein [Candidatus Dormibacteraeota bacterium]
MTTPFAADSPAVEARHLVKQYGRITAVDGVSFQAMRGEIFGFLGANGAGKTTTLRMLCGLLRPTYGSALIDGIDIVAQPLEAKARLGYLDEEPFVHPHLTGREFLNFVADLYRMPRGQQREERMARLLSLFDLAKKNGELIGGYSHGMRQKIGLASLLIREPSVLLLDEPTNGLDPRSARLVKDLLEELAARGTTVLLSTHILEVAQALCRRIAIIDRGHIVAIGSMEELRVQAGSEGANLEDLFLKLTAGPESREMIEQLLDAKS